MKKKRKTKDNDQAVAPQSLSSLSCLPPPPFTPLSSGVRLTPASSKCSFVSVSFRFLAFIAQDSCSKVVFSFVSLISHAASFSCFLHRVSFTPNPSLILISFPHHLSFNYSFLYSLFISFLCLGCPSFLSAFSLLYIIKYTACTKASFGHGYHILIFVHFFYKLHTKWAVYFLLPLTLMVLH